MNRDRFQFVCNESEEGRDAFVINSTAREEGRVLECTREHVVVETSSGDKRCWDYNQCEELARDKAEWPWR